MTDGSKFRHFSRQEAISGGFPVETAVRPSEPESRQESPETGRNGRPRFGLLLRVRRSRMKQGAEDEL